MRVKIPSLALAACVLCGGLVTVSAPWAHPDLDWQIVRVTERIEADPRNAELYLQRGDLHRLHRDWPAAERDYRRARKLRRDLVVVDFYMGKLKLDAGLPKQAEKRLRRFLAREPGHAAARLDLARALVLLDEPLAAAREYTRAIEAYGEDRRPEPADYLDRARALAGAGDEHVDDALRGLDEGLERLGYPITLQLYAIELELQVDRHDAALDRLAQIAAGTQRQETWLVRRGEILESANRPIEARSAYAAALEALDALPAGRSGTRAMRRLRDQAVTALGRLEEAAAND